MLKGVITIRRQGITTVTTRELNDPHQAVMAVHLVQPTIPIALLDPPHTQPPTQPHLATQELTSTSGHTVHQAT